MEEKIPPHDLDAEQSALGSMMISKDAIAIAIGILKPDHFYRSAHGQIFNAMVTLYQQNEPIDLVTVSSLLKQQDQLDEIGGRSYLAEVLDAVPTASNILKYAQIVFDKALLRKLIDAGSHIVGEAFDDSVEAAQVIEESQKVIMDLSKETVKEDFVKLDVVIKDVFDNIQSVYDQEDKLLGVSTGYPDLDTMLNGFQKSDLIILAARPAMGKTTLALNFAANAAVESGVPVAIFSLEMPKEQLAMRLLASESKLDSKRLRSANLQDHEYRDLIQAMGRLSEAPIYIDDKPGISPLELRAKTRRLQAEADIGLILIDYMQLMRSSKRKVESRFHEISEIVREVKGFAKESQIPIIALSQLSRAVEQRQDKKPMLSDLRESGEIEQTADLVLFIHRDDYYESVEGDGSNNNMPSPTDIVIAKHRNGPTGDVKLMFRKDVSRFISAERTHVVPE